MRQRRVGSRYVLVDLVGRGAMGQVYKARVEEPPPRRHDDDAGEAHVVAVKLLREDLGSDPDLVHRFLQESRLLRSVDHPNVVRIRDMVAEADLLAIVMDLVEGGDLRRSVAMPCPQERATQIAAGIAAGLAAVHAAGIVHRDLKPENVLIERMGDGLARPRIADFGVSRFDSATTTRTRGMTGTVGYIAPEIAQGGSATPASDVYALGIILYELCAGHGPFRGEHPVALIRAHAEDPVPRPDDLSDELWDLLEDLLAKDPTGRPAADEVALRLEAFGLAPTADRADVPPGCFALGPSKTSGQEASGAQAATTPGDRAPAPATLAGLSPGIEVDDPLPDVDPAQVAPVADEPDPAPVGPVAIMRPEGPRPPIDPVPDDDRPGRRTVVPVVAAAGVIAVLLAAAVTWLAWPRTAATTRSVAVAAGSEPTTHRPLPPEETAPTSPAAGTTRTGTLPATHPPATQTVTRTVIRPPHLDRGPNAALVAPSSPSEAGSASPPRAAGAALARRTTSTPPPSSPPPSSPPPSSPAPDPRQGMVPLHRYYNGSTGDHFYTTNYAELGGGGIGYRYEGVQAYVYPSAAAGTVPLHRYYNGSTGDHFYTTNYAELGGGGIGYRYEGVQAYVYPSAAAGTVPLHRYYNGSTGDHFYTTNYAELGSGGGGYVYEGVAGYLR